MSQPSPKRRKKERERERSNTWKHVFHAPLGVSVVVVVVVVVVLVALQTRRSPAPSEEPAPIKELTAATVKITVMHGGGVAVGAGVILCQRLGQVQILTAKHVVKRYTKDQTIEIAFYGNHPVPIRGRPKDFFIEKPESKDLALLQLAHVEVAVTTATLASVVAVSRDETESIGHQAVSGTNWLRLPGEVSKVDEFIHHTSDIESGYSGGPLFNHAGEVIGINIQRVGLMARAIPIDEARGAFPWIDECLRASEGSRRPPG